MLSSCMKRRSRGSRKRRVRPRHIFGAYYKTQRLKPFRRHCTFRERHVLTRLTRHRPAWIILPLTVHLVCIKCNFTEQKLDNITPLTGMLKDMASRYPSANFMAKLLESISKTVTIRLTGRTDMPSGVEERPDALETDLLARAAQMIRSSLAEQVLAEEIV